MMQHDFIAPNINIEALDENSQKLHIITQTTQSPYALFCLIPLALAEQIQPL
ncbi:hypothetical protein HMPREF1551_02792 [Capnocytophaga sp. oral taxon 863 str. F0517]|nr:hypothetical protein HMPREF1551_02792 [Capnocytophaga sp. oral taxon 863 str. F0517]